MGEHKVGDRLVYSEDGYHLAVEVLANRSTLEHEAYKIKVLGIIKRSSFLPPDCVPGDESEISRPVGFAYAGMWHLRTLDEFADDYEDRIAAVEPYRR